MGNEGFSPKDLEGYGLPEHTCTLDQLRLDQNFSFLVIRYLHFYYLLFLTMCVEVGGQFVKIGYLFPCESQGLNSSQQACRNHLANPGSAFQFFLLYILGIH